MFQELPHKLKKYSNILWTQFQINILVLIIILQHSFPHGCNGIAVFGLVYCHLDVNKNKSILSSIWCHIGRRNFDMPEDVYTKVYSRKLNHSYLKYYLCLILTSKHTLTSATWKQQFAAVVGVKTSTLHVWHLLWLKLGRAKSKSKCVI